MSTISERTTVPLPWLVAGVAVTFSAALTLGFAYRSIMEQLNNLQAEVHALRQTQWTAAHMELWVEKARQRTQEKLPDVSEVRR